MTITNLILSALIVLLAVYCGLLRLRLRTADDGKAPGGDLQLHVTNSDIMQFIKDTANDFIPLTDSKGIGFRIRCSPESMMGWIDAGKIEKALLVLLSDIIKGLQEEGKVTLDANTNSSYDHITIRISDNGQQLTGMGYPIAFNLIHLHHGSIKTEYYKGQGNTTVIELPIRKETFRTAQTGEGQQAVFQIPTNIVLNVPTIDLPPGYENGGKSLGDIIHDTYVSADQEYLQRAIRCVNVNIMDSDYDRERFAADMGSSVSTLYNKIRAITGKNVTNFIRDIRIKKACKLAKENPDLRVSDIAYRVGFKDPKYFATSFKRVTGMQPKEYFGKLRAKGEE